MIRIIRAEKLRECLSGLRQVADRYEKGQQDFPALTLDWLDAAETLLRQERLPQATEVLTARTRIMATRDRSHAEGKTGTARRRAEAVAAVDALCLAEALLRLQLLAIEEEIDAYEEKLVEAVTGLIVLGCLPPMEGAGRNGWTERVWSALASRAETRPTAAWLSAALAAPDRLFLLDRILQRVRSSEFVGPAAVLDKTEPTQESERH